MLISGAMERLKRVKKYIARKLRLAGSILLGRRPSSRQAVNTRRRKYSRSPLETPTNVEGDSKRKGEQSAVDPPPKQKVSSWQHCADIPTSMRAPQAIIFEDQLFIGGGHTGTSATDSTVYKYSPANDAWSYLPPAPMKWFGLTIFNEQLILVGGREVNSRDFKLTNKIASWDESEQAWKFTLPSMTFARVSPVAFSREGSLIVAGGERGSLDYNVEVLHPSTSRWMIASSLPTECFPSNSAACENTWYLLQNQHILSVHIGELLQRTLASCNGISEEQEALSNPCEDKAITSRKLWECIRGPPAGESTCITTINNHVVVTTIEGELYLLESHGEAAQWRRIGNIPVQASCCVVGDNQDRLFLIGGETSTGLFSSKI